MIFDKLENAKNYFQLHPKFENAFKFLSDADIAGLDLATYDIDGKDVYAMITSKHGKKKADAKLEAHRKYIDIQFLIMGEEQIGWKAYNDCKIVSSPFNPENDIEFFEDEVQTYFKLVPNTFAIFFPEDSHAPMVSETNVHKVVIKVKLT